MNRNRRRLTTWLIVSAAVTLISAVATAQMPVDHCGQTLAKSGTYVLTTDLDCSGTFANGINVAASNIRFHLGNHTLSSADCDLTKTIYGIFVPGNVSNVNLDGGKVRGFVDGVVLSSSKSRISAMTVTEACQFGIAVQNDRNVVTTSRVNHSGVDGIGLLFATNTRIIANDISDNLGNGVGLSGSSHNFVAFNILSRNTASGVLISGESFNTVANNEFDINFDGIELEDTDNTVQQNTIRGSLDVGIYLAGSASPAHITHNAVLGSGLSDMSDASPSCALNKWISNIFETDLVSGVSDGGPGRGCIR